jgi:hypothetical protein
MQQFPDPSELAERIFKILGGKEKAFEIIDTEVDEKRKRWDQDVDAIGRILRAHLYVEHYLTENLVKSNPRLGSVDQARLTFLQKLELLDKDSHPLFSEVIPGLRRLNSIRNRLSHQLRATVTQEDAAVLLAAPYFNAFRKRRVYPNEPNSDPLQILEEFSWFASSTLNHEFSQVGKAMSEAFHQFKSEQTT